MKYHSIKDSAREREDYTRGEEEFRIKGGDLYPRRKKEESSRLFKIIIK